MSAAPRHAIYQDGQALTRKVVELWTRGLNTYDISILISTKHPDKHTVIPECVIDRIISDYMQNKYEGRA